MKQLALAVCWLFMSCAPAIAAVDSGSGSACPPPSQIGATISPANTACVLNAYPGGWQFKSSKPDADGNYSLHNQMWYAPGATQAKLCAGVDKTFNPYVSYSRLKRGQTFWYANAFYQEHIQATAACAPALDSFHNVTKHASYASLTQAIKNASAKDVVQINRQPAGIPAWTSAGNSQDGPGNASINVPGLTINIDAGTKFDGNSGNFMALQPPGQGYWVVQANDVTVNGGEFFADNCRSNCSAIRITNNAAGTTIENADIHDCDTCILSGAHTGNITFSNVTVEHGGIANGLVGGQDHNIYLSAATDGMENGIVTVKNVTTLNVESGRTDGKQANDKTGGWLFKDRKPVSTFTNFTAACTDKLCETNGNLDFPCGGNQKISHAIFERGPLADNWFFIRFGEEWRGNGKNCPAVPYAVNTVTIDHTIFIDDGPCQNASGSQFIVVLCTGGGANGGCAGTTIKGTAATITNSTLVKNPSCPTNKYIWGASGVVAGDQTDKIVASRTAAGIAAFPALPPMP